jgi:predicted PolB exonuclease-like 3'-5' exonuclease
LAPGAKSTLHELCRVLGLPGKLDGINGGEVAQYYRDGRIREIADYCESDVVNTYRV